MNISWARLANFCHLGVNSDPLIVSKFHNETHDPKGQENKIYTIVKGRETFYRRHRVPVTNCSEVKYVLKRVSFGSKDCTKELKLECAYFLGQNSHLVPMPVNDKLTVKQIMLMGFSSAKILLYCVKVVHFQTTTTLLATLSAGAKTNILYN